MAYVILPPPPPAPRRHRHGRAQAARACPAALPRRRSVLLRTPPPMLAGARRLINERPGARVRRVRTMGHEPLANLWELHPEARRAAIRELGLMSVPIDQIRGTAVEGGAQRGGDFLPLKNRRSTDWRAR